MTLSLGIIAVDIAGIRNTIEVFAVGAKIVVLQSVV